jgi:hypothetical protein
VRPGGPGKTTTRASTTCRDDSGRWQAGSTRRGSINDRRAYCTGCTGAEQPFLCFFFASDHRARARGLPPGGLVEKLAPSGFHQKAPGASPVACSGADPCVSPRASASRLCGKGLRPTALWGNKKHRARARWHAQPRAASPHNGAGRSRREKMIPPITKPSTPAPSSTPS